MHHPMTRKTLPLLPVLLAGCNSLWNGWLDPTILGSFDRDRTTEIRTSLTIEDMPIGIPGAVDPTQQDLEVVPREYPITPGDTLGVVIDQLTRRDIPFEAQVQVNDSGEINLPMVGRVPVAGLTTREFEQKLGEVLAEKELLKDPSVTVNPIFLQRATYSIFGVGVSASNQAPLRAGTFPILRPDLRLLEAINRVGGLNEFVTEVYVFRSEEPPAAGTGFPAPTPAPATPPNGPEIPIPQPPLGSPTGLEKPDGPPDGAVKKPNNHETKPKDERQAIMEAVIQPEEPKPEPQEVPEELEPEPQPPFIWVNGEFIPNPAVTGRPAAPETAEPPTPPPFEPASPMINWSRIAGDSDFRIIRVSAEQLRSGEPQSNIVIRGGDVIRIVSGEIGVYYVMGQVARVGPFAFNSEPITLKAAIAAAGGLTGLAWPDRCTVYRKVGQRQLMIQVDLDAIFAGKDDDFLIRRGDIINVGTHPFAPFLRSIRGLTIPNPVSNVGYSFTYARNYADIDSFGAKINPANQPEQFPNLFP